MRLRILATIAIDPLFEIIRTLVAINSCTSPRSHIGTSSVPPPTTMFADPASAFSFGVKSPYTSSKRAPFGFTPRRLFLKQGVFLAHGTSWHCAGRRALLSGGRAQGHTEECRNRVEGELNKTEVDKLRDVRQREFDLQEVQDATSWTVREKYKRVSQRRRRQRRHPPLLLLSPCRPALQPQLLSKC